jgi:hypothetical protein
MDHQFPIEVVSFSSGQHAHNATGVSDEKRFLCVSDWSSVVGIRYVGCNGISRELCQVG